MKMSKAKGSVRYQQERKHSEFTIPPMGSTSTQSGHQFGSRIRDAVQTRRVSGLGNLNLPSNLKNGGNSNHKYSGNSPTSGKSVPTGGRGGSLSERRSGIAPGSK